MDRLTRPDIEALQTAVRFMGTEVKIQDISDKLVHLILNGPTINGINKDTLRHMVRQLYNELKAYEDLEMTPEDIEHTLKNFSSFLMEMTGGRMSKTNYTVQAMVAEANDHFESVCDECSDRQELAEIKKEMEIANETKMMFATEEENQHDKEIFVRNLGWLLSQTREQVERCYLDEEEQVHVVFRGGSERTVNVKHDSYAAIIRDVAKAL